jgi:hypothetical protein
MSALCLKTIAVRLGKHKVRLEFKSFMVRSRAQLSVTRPISPTLLSGKLQNWLQLFIEELFHSCSDVC